MWGAKLGGRGPQAENAHGPWGGGIRKENQLRPTWQAQRERGAEAVGSSGAGLASHWEAWPCH